MDTDYLTEDAYNVLIVESGKVLDYLRSDIAVDSRMYHNEDEYLKGALEELNEIAEDPMDYLDGWSLEDEVDVNDFKQGILKLIEKVKQVINIPYKDRVPSEFK
jgi:DNA-directed RNA polymerase specialized sigma subunit